MSLNGPVLWLEGSSPEGVTNLGLAFQLGGGVTFGVAYAVTVKNVGTQPLLVTNVSIQVTQGKASDWALGGTINYPNTIAPGTSAVLIGLQFTGAAASPGAIETCVLTLNSNSVTGSVLTFEFQAGVSSSTSPVGFGTQITATNFFQVPGAVGVAGSQTIGSSFTATFEMTCGTPTGGGGAGVTVTAVADATQGWSISPTTATIAQGASQTFTLTQAAAVAGGIQDDPIAATLTDSNGNVYNLEVYYVTPLLAQFAVLAGATEGAVMAIAGGAQPLLGQFEPTGNTDAPITFSRQYYVDQAHLNKIVNRLWLLFEREAAFSLTVTGSVINPSNTNPSSATLISAIGNEQLYITAGDLQITGSCITLTFTAAAGTSQFSLLGFILKLDEAGEVIENT